MSDDLKRLLSAAEELGFTQEHGTGSARHLRFIHSETGAICIAAATPSDWRARLNEISRMERMSGRKLKRQHSGRSRFKRVEHIDLNLSPTEMRDLNVIDDLVTRATRIRDEFRGLTEAPTRNGAEQARKLLLDYEDVRSQLAARHRMIDPIY